MEAVAGSTYLLLPIDCRYALYSGIVIDMGNATEGHIKRYGRKKLQRIEMKLPRTVLALVLAMSTVAISQRPAQASVAGSNGRIAFVSDRDGDKEIYTMDPDGMNVVQLTDNSTIDDAPAWSPDGTEIAFHSTRGGVDLEIYLMNADGSNVQQLTDNSTNDGAPGWSPDGSRIVFDSERDAIYTNEIYVMNADGTGTMRLTTNSVEDDLPDWSPDGTKIAFVSQETRMSNFDIYVMDVAGSALTRLTTDPGFDHAPSWSPDGTKIAFDSDREGGPGGPTDLFTMNADGSEQTNVTPSGNEWMPTWSPDGTRLAFVSSTSNNEIFTLNIGNGSAAEAENRTSHDARDEWPDWQALPPDADGDGVPDDEDNCSQVSNGGQTDGDMDGKGDRCDNDDDNDGLVDSEDQCSKTAGPANLGGCLASDISLRLSKSANHVTVQGRVVPSHREGRVRVSLHRRNGQSFVRLQLKHPALSAQSRYLANLVRPRRGTCQVRVRFTGDLDHAAATNRKVFNC